MSICFVAPLRASRTRGYSVERYAFEVQRGLKQRGLDVMLISSSPVLERVERRRVGRAVGVIHEGAKVIRDAGRASLVHYADPVVGLTGLAVRSVPIITTVHEVPDIWSHRDALVLGMSLLRRVCRQSDALIADSTLTKEDLVEKIGVSPEKVSVVGLGVSPDFAPSRSKEIRSTKTIGYIGAYSPRKNVRLLLQAYGILRKEHPDLDLGLQMWGRTGGYADEIQSTIKNLNLSDVRLMGFAGESDLPQIYNSFDVFVFPSLKEGFGLPILEAKRCGVPTVVLEGAQIAKEVTHGSVMCVDPHDMSDKIYSLLTDPERADATAREGLKYSMDFTWERTVEGVLKVYRSLGVRLNGKSVSEINCVLPS